MNLKRRLNYQTWEAGMGGSGVQADANIKSYNTFLLPTAFD